MNYEKMIFLEKINRTFCGSDPTNSLSNENPLGKSLLEKYGNPVVQKTAKDLAKSLTEEKNKKAIEFRKLTPPPGFESMHEQIKSSVMLGYQMEIDHYLAMGMKTAYLEWKDSSTVLSIKDSLAECSTGKNFEMELTSTKGLEWMNNAKKNQKDLEKKRSETATIPSL